MLASIPFESDARYESDENENNAEKKTREREREIQWEKFRNQTYLSITRNYFRVNV